MKLVSQFYQKSSVEGVLEQNPSKQGLKLALLQHLQHNPPSVLEQNPSKQGLKPKIRQKNPILEVCFRAKSIKTRIETHIEAVRQGGNKKVLEQNPSKQGLKQIAFTCFGIVIEF